MTDEDIVMFNREAATAAVREAKALPIREVTRDEFIAAFIAIGMKRKKAEQQANFARIMGSEVVCGNELLILKPTEKPG